MIITFNLYEINLTTNKQVLYQIFLSTFAQRPLSTTVNISVIYYISVVKNSIKVFIVVYKITMQ